MPAGAWDQSGGAGCATESGEGRGVCVGEGSYECRFGRRRLTRGVAEAAQRGRFWAERVP
eukprot:769266-Rhodomonas_salina.2